MTLLNALGDGARWERYYEYKLERAHLPAHEQSALLDFIRGGAYSALAQRIAREGFCFPPPEKRLINKLGSDKKRTVYAFPYEEGLMLKLLAFELYAYDGAHCDGCYSFRRDRGARLAIKRLAATPGIRNMYCCKLDISDYFNSIDTDMLLPMLKTLFEGDEPLYLFFHDMLKADCALAEGELVHEKRGAMAGTPVSPFLANIYLKPLDEYFQKEGAPYARYSDDIIFFAPDEQTLSRLRGDALGIISALGLSINEKKAYTAAPGESWEYLGIEYRDGEVELSRATRDKLKGKLRRKARALNRWRLKKNAPPERAVTACVRSINRKLFDDAGANELTWARWFFPLITTAEGLHEMDAYIQQCLRYVATGGHGKANYRIDYDTLKRCGYRSLVNEYYKYRAGLKQLEQLGHADAKIVAHGVAEYAADEPGEDDLFIL